MNKSLINLIIILNNLWYCVVLPFLGEGAVCLLPDPPVEVAQGSLAEPAAHAAEVGDPGGAGPRGTNRGVPLLLGHHSSTSFRQLRELGHQGT